MHEGIDFHAPTGTEVYATADGVVKDVRTSETFGKVIVIDHGYGLETFYAHLNAYNVRIGQKVARGQPYRVCRQYRTFKGTTFAL